MFTLQSNYIVNVSNLEKSIDFYQTALGLHLMSRDIINNQVLLSDEKEEFKLILLLGGIDKSILSFKCNNINSAHKLHRTMNCIKSENSENASYYIHDLDGNNIYVESEMEYIKAQIKNIENNPNNDWSEQ